MNRQWHKITKLIYRLPFEFLCYLVMLVVNILPRIDVIDRIRFVFLRMLGLKGHGRFTILAPIEIAPYCAQGRISISGPSFVNSGVRFGVPSGGRVVIKKGAAIGPRVQFECMNHGLQILDGERTGANAGSIVVEEDAWIGASAIILADVTIGKGAVVAAGSVVNKDVPPFTLVAGVPAREKKQLSVAAL